MLFAPPAAPRPPRTRIASLAVTALFHAALIGLALSHQPPSLAQAQGSPIMVSFITPEPVERPKPTPPEPVVKPKPKPKKEIAKPKPKAEPKPKQVIAAKRPEPAPFVAPPEPKPEPEPVAAPEPEPAPPAAEPAPAPVEIAPPRFSADYLRNPKPNYPGLSRRLHEEGTVVLRVYVSPQGAPERVELNKSSGYARLDESALETVKQHWKFVPAKRGNTPIGGWVLVPIAFTLQG